MIFAFTNKQMKYTITTILLFIFATEFCFATESLTFGQRHPFMATTRDSFDTTNGNIIQQPNLPSALSILRIENCPGTLVIYVHGVWSSSQEAEEQTDRIYSSLLSNGYNITVIGYSWDSDTIENPSGWSIAKSIANENGPILANFIKDYKTQCPEDELRIIAHSLGSRVILSSIQSLYDNNPQVLIADIITSVHLLGAAVDDEQISIDDLDECHYLNRPSLKCSGESVSIVVRHFYNLYNSEDNMLAPQKFCLECSCPSCFESPYQFYENDNPLGAYPIKNSVNTPLNYDEYSVEDIIEIIDDANGDGECDLVFAGICTIRFFGDNHFGYLGYRSVEAPHNVYNSDVIGSVTTDWTAEINR